MGLKFKKFKAKLTWKTKETVPDVVCLRYHINSEFDKPLSPPVIPTTSNKSTNDVIKQKKVAAKPPVQDLFTSNPPGVAPPPPANGDLATNQKQNTPSTVPEPPVHVQVAPPKGILKKSPTIEDTNTEDKSPSTLAQPEGAHNTEPDDKGKSALIFMTENHDDSEPTHPEPDWSPVPSPVELRKKDNQSPTKTINLNNQETKQEMNEDRRMSGSSTESQHADSKTVRWRNTVVEIKLDERPESGVVTNEEPDDFKVHFVKHMDVSARGMRGAEESDVEGSEPEDEDVQEANVPYRSRGAYSSQAASIFFAGEEPEPTARVRNVSKYDEDDKDV